MIDKKEVKYSIHSEYNRLAKGNKTMAMTIFDISKLSSFIKEVPLEKLINFPVTHNFKSSDKKI